MAFTALPPALGYLRVRIKSPVPLGLFSLSATSGLPQGRLKGSFPQKRWGGPGDGTKRGVGNRPRASWSKNREESGHLSEGECFLGPRNCRVTQAGPASMPTEGQKGRRECGLLRACYHQPLALVFPLITLILFLVGFDYSHLPDEESGAQRGEVTQLYSHSR